MPFREMGVPSIQQIEDKTGDFNRYYHAAGDTVDHMDHDYYLAMVRALVATMTHFAVPVTADPRPTATPRPTVSVPTDTPTTVPTATITPSASRTLPLPSTDTPTPDATVTPVTRPSAVPTEPAPATGSPPPTILPPPAWSARIHLPIAVRGIHGA